MKPFIVLAFANDKDNYLPMIVRESKNIYKTLQTHHDNGYVQVHKEENTSVGDIFELFNRYRERIAILRWPAGFLFKKPLTRAKHLLPPGMARPKRSTVSLTGGPTWKQRSRRGKNSPGGCTSMKRGGKSWSGNCPQPTGIGFVFTVQGSQRARA